MKALTIISQPLQHISFLAIALLSYRNHLNMLTEVATITTDHNPSQFAGLSADEFVTCQVISLESTSTSSLLQELSRTEDFSAFVWLVSPLVSDSSVSGPYWHLCVARC